MDKYIIKLLPKAYRDIDNIYQYIYEEFKASKTAQNIVELIEESIFKLEEFPNRGLERKVGIYAKRGYRQTFVKNFTIVYRVDERLKYVVIVVVKYSPSSF